MSLDVYLEVEKSLPRKGSGIFIREDGERKEISREEWDEKFPDRDPMLVNYENEETNKVYSGNITHNLTSMADEAGIYQALWRPEELGISHAYQLIDILSNGLSLLKENPDRFKAFNPSNGWG